MHSFKDRKNRVLAQRRVWRRCGHRVVVQAGADGEGGRVHGPRSAPQPRPNIYLSFFSFFLFACLLSSFLSSLTG